MTSLFIINHFNHNSKNYSKLFEIYNAIYSDIILNKYIITNNKIIFNNYRGDITKEINWTWVINDIGFQEFNKFFEEIKLIEFLNTKFKNKFKIIGISYISIFKSIINDDESEFHYDILSPYDIDNQTNIITVLIPLIINQDSGLEYLKNNCKTNYKYKIDEYCAFDSSKVKHRTQPFTQNKENKRVLLSINLSSFNNWATIATQRCTFSQGNHKL